MDFNTLVAAEDFSDLKALAELFATEAPAELQEKGLAVKVPVKSYVKLAKGERLKTGALVSFKTHGVVYEGTFVKHLGVVKVGERKMSNGSVSAMEAKACLVKVNGEDTVLPYIILRKVVES